MDIGHCHCCFFFKFQTFAERRRQKRITASWFCFQVLVLGEVLRKDSAPVWPADCFSLCAHCIPLLFRTVVTALCAFHCSVCPACSVHCAPTALPLCACTVQSHISIATAPPCQVPGENTNICSFNGSRPDASCCIP